MTNRDKVQAIINEFNALVDSGRLQGYMNLLQDGNKFILVLGRAEQFAYNTYQCILCKGTIDECYKVANAIKLTLEFEISMY